MTVFCVEDDRPIRELVLYTLRSTGFDAVGFSDGGEFFAALKEGSPDIVLLDIMLPGDDGLTILKKLKDTSETSEIPVIMVTAKTTEFDRVSGLDFGADDYISKPFGMMELVARINAVLRRVGRESETSLSLSGIEVDAARHRVTAGGKSVDFTLKEFQLLQLLMENAGIVLTRDALLTRLWGYDFDGETRTVDVHVRRLREKLGEYGNAIETIRGVGYKFGEKK